MAGEIARVSAAAKAEGGNGAAVGESAIVQAFWGGTPEPSRPMVQQALEQTGLWQFVAEAKAP